MLNPLLRYNCQLCQDEVKGEMLRAPGTVKMGRVMMETHVCGSCHDNMSVAADDFFRQSMATHTTKCNSCEEGFGADGPYYAHRRPVTKEQWKTVPVCKTCFGKYSDCCNLVAKGGR